MLPRISLPIEPRVWIGCLACYADGRLTGDWHDAVAADGVTPEQLHGQPTSHDELWGFDHEGLPVTGELDPSRAAALARRIEEVDEHLRDAFRAWALHGSVVEDALGLPSLDGFEESYAGEWASFDEYAHQLAEDIDLLGGVGQEVARYFDWSAWVRDLAMDYSVLEAPHGRVYVFRAL